MVRELRLTLLVISEWKRNGLIHVFYIKNR
jgi:hypothetical protein